MTMTLRCAIVFTSVLACLIVGSVSDTARIDIKPRKAMSTLEKSVQISCVADSNDDDSAKKDITLIELSRNNEDPIVYVRDCSNITYGNGRTKQFKAEGHIDQDPGKSYLNVTLLNPTSEDTGIYTCLVLYIDGSGHPQQHTSTSDLTIEKLDMTSLETALTSIKDTMTQMEKDQKKRMDELEAKVMTNMPSLAKEATQQIQGISDGVLRNISALEARMTQQMNDISDKDKYMVAFSAAATKRGSDFIRPSSGDVLVLSDVLMRVGQGYDQSTGKFTAPRDGIYAFHLVVTDGTHKRLDMDLKRNDQVIARLYASATGSWEQASASAVTNLKAGDVVFSVFKGNGVAIRDDRYSVFTGYLLKAL